VTVAWPKASVDGIADFIVPHAGPFIVNITGSPPLTLTGPLITVAVTVEVDTPSAVMLDGLATNVTVSGTGGAGLSVWMIVVAPCPTVAGSVAITPQNPTVVDAVYATFS
jgi:hypothetical protein